MNISERIKNLRRDIINNDVECMATLSDLENVACECIKTNRKVEGCNLLVVYGRVLAMRGQQKRQEWLKELSLRLDEAERVLS